MQLDDMILVSIDDHFIEPPDMYKNHVPEKWLDDMPKVVRNAQGVDEWVFQGEATSTPFGMAATVGLAAGGVGLQPRLLRPSCGPAASTSTTAWRDMNANGVLASMNFPTMAGWNARTFAEGDNKELGLVMLRGYNDWVIDEWCAAYPGRFIPLGIVPMWDVDLAVEEIHRIGKKGCRSVSFLETPHVQGYPSFLSGYWDPMMQALVRREHGAVAAHRRRLRRDQPPRGGADRPPHGAGLPDQRHHRPGPPLRPDLRQFPDLKVALSEGGIGWIPFYFDRIDRHFENQKWLHDADDFGGKMPSEVFRDHILACFITDPSGLELRHRIGIDIIAWECDYPHTDTTWPESPEFSWKEFQDAGCTDDEIHEMTWENSCRFFDWDPFQHTPKERGDGRRAAGAGQRRRHDPHVSWRVEGAERGRRHRRVLTPPEPSWLGALREPTRLEPPCPSDRVTVRPADRLTDRGRTAAQENAG